MFMLLVPLICITVRPMVSGAEPSAQRIPQPQLNLLFFIDTTEKGDLNSEETPVAWACQEALKAPEALIIASNHVLHACNFFTTQHGWRAYAASEQTSLLVPRNLVASLRTRHRIDDSVDDDHVLGMRISGYREITSKAPANTTPSISEHSARAKRDIITLLIPRSAYQKRPQKMIKPPLFALVFVGHGAAPVAGEEAGDHPIEEPGRIAGFMVPDFRELIAELGGHHRTRSEELTKGRQKQEQLGIINILALFNISCFTGDLNMLSSFSRSEEALLTPYEFPFPIVISTLLSAMVLSSTGAYHYDEFYRTLWQRSETTHQMRVKLKKADDLSSIEGDAEVLALYPDLLGALAHIYPVSQPDMPANIPMVKYPGIPYFMPLDPATYANIGKIMGQTRTAPLRIPDSFGTKRHIMFVFVHAQTVPFPVIITGKELPIFFSATPGPQLHAFTRRFDAPACTFSSVINAFAPIKQRQWKAFTFKKIRAIDDIKPTESGQIEEFADVAIINYLKEVTKKVGNREDLYRVPTLSVSYRLNGRTFGYEKMLWHEIEVGTLSNDLKSGLAPAGEGELASIAKLLKTIKILASHPALASGEHPVATEQLEAMLKKRKPQEKDAIQNLAESLKRLIQ